MIGDVLKTVYIFNDHLNYSTNQNLYWAISKTNIFGMYWQPKNSYKRT